MATGDRGRTAGNPRADRGVVVNFDPERGFGFVRPSGRDEDIFVHINDVAGRVPLKAGQRVRFSAEPGEKGPRAVRVVPGRRGLSPAAGGAAGLLGALAALTLALRWLGWPWNWAWAAAVNPITFAAYAWDKHRGRTHRRRVPEWVLLALAFVGGWPSAALAMALLGHKTRKTSFRWAFAGVVALQLALLAAWARKG